MDATAAELTAFLERDKIRDCIARLARGEDRRDAGIIRTCYWPEAVNDYGVWIGNFDEYLAWVVPGSEAILLTQHVLGQTLIELNGDTASTETHVLSYHRIDMGKEHRDTMIGGRYLDRMEKRKGEWRIAKRMMLYDWSQDFGVAADFSQGAMGLPFSADHFAGRKIGDYSETFFGKKSSGR